MLRFLKPDRSNEPANSSRSGSLDFIIAGAEKAGTSYLSSVLRKCDSISMPEHEVRHFRDPFYPDQDRVDALVDDKNGRLAGIKHPSYLGRSEVPERIHKHNPDIKLIFILRNPVERAISSYLHYIRHGQIPLIHPNDGLLRLAEDAHKYPKYRDIFQFGLYYKYLSLYLKHFDKSQILILEYEDFLDGSVDMKPITDFLSIPAVHHAPESRINKGSYDWNKCKVDFIRAHAFNVYDEALNILDLRKHAYLESFDAQLPSLREALKPDPIIVADDTRAALEKLYRDDINQLKKSGLLVPKHW